MADYMDISNFSEYMLDDSNWTDGRGSDQVGSKIDRVPCYSSDEYDALVIFICITLLFTTMCVIGNSLVITVIARERRLQQPLNFFIINLAVSDLMIGVTYSVYNISHLEIDGINNTIGVWEFCLTNVILLTTSQIASGFNLVGITFVRFMAVRQPTNYRKTLTRRRMVYAIAFIWVLSLSGSIISQVRPKPVSYCGVCRTELFWGSDSLFGHTLFAIAIPFTLMLMFSIMMIRDYRIHVQRMLQVRRGSLQRPQHNIQRRKETKLTIMALFLSSYYALSYLPFLVFVVHHFRCDCIISVYYRVISRLMLFSNTSVNFFAYIVAHEDFRTALYKFLCLKRHRKQLRSTSGSDDVIHRTRASNSESMEMNGGVRSVQQDFASLDTIRRPSWGGSATSNESPSSNLSYLTESTRTERSNSTSALVNSNNNSVCRSVSSPAELSPRDYMRYLR